MRIKIGLFDSGSGARTVFQELSSALPDCTIFSYEDRSHFPLSEKSAREILQITSDGVEFLKTLSVDLVVLACHTASVCSLPFLQKQHSIPIIGMQNATIESIKHFPSQAKLIFLGTKATVQSGYYQQEIQKIYPEMRLYPHACLNLARAIEENVVTPAFLKKEIAPIFDYEADGLILGCTHYPLIQSTFEKLFPKLEIINPAKNLPQFVKECFAQAVS